MPLKYLPFRYCPGMEEASKNAPALALGSRGPAVALLQGALIDLGEKLPESAKKGGPDGRFGVETQNAVISYQRTKKLKPDGIAGMKTINALDDDMVKATTVIIPSPPPPPVVLATPHYGIGNGDPPLSHDPGAGAWKSKSTEASYVALKLTILRFLPEAYVIIGDDAAKHMAHYLGNSGRDYTVDLEDMVDDVPSARSAYEAEVAQAQALVEKLPVGKHPIHSLRAENAYNHQSENRNWFFAIGGYTKWGEATATVKTDSGTPEYELDFTYKFYDRYNWDAGKKVTFNGITITDQFMGEFHRQGLAKEFDCWGSFKRHFTWKKGGAIPQQQLYARTGR